MGCEIADTSTNFLFVKPPDGDGERLYNSLKDRGILTRWFAGEVVASRIRITIGTDDEIDKLVWEIREILKQ